MAESRTMRDSSICEDDDELRGAVKIKNIDKVKTFDWTGGEIMNSVTFGKWTFRTMLFVNEEGKVATGAVWEASAAAVAT